MEEKKSYSIDQIIEEARKKPSHSVKDISAAADKQAQEILKSIKLDNPATEDDGFDALLKTITERNVQSGKTAKREHKAEEREEPKPIESIEPKKEEPKVAPVSGVISETEIKVAPEPSDEPQIKKKHGSIDDVILSVSKDANKIDKAMLNENGESEAKKEKQLTRTGVIRKANALIGADEEDGIKRNTPANTAPQMGALHREEKIVGEKEDIQTKAYHEYIKRKEKKKQDTGIIKTIDIKLARDVHKEKELEKTIVRDPIKPVNKPDSEEEKTKRREPVKEPENAFEGEEKTKRREPIKDIDNTFLPPLDGKSIDETVLPAPEPEAQKIEKTLVRSGKTEPFKKINRTGNIEGQTRLKGFDDDNAQKITEDELEEQLDRNRQIKIDSFEFEKDYAKKKEGPAETAPWVSIDDTYAPPKETPIIHDVVDYNSRSDRRAIYLELEGMVNKFNLRTILCLAAELVIAVIGIFGSGILTDFGLGTGGEQVYIILNMALLLFMSIISIKAILKGFQALFTLKPSSDSLVSVAVLFSFLHSILALTIGQAGAGVSHIFTATTGFILLLNAIGKRSMTRRIFRNFRFIIKGGDKYTAARITDDRETQEFSKGTELETGDIRYNVKTEFPTRFLANSYADDPSDMIAKLTVYPALGASLIIAIITFVISLDWLTAVTALTASVLISTPVSAILSFNKALENADRDLLKERGTLSGFAAVEDAASTNCVVLEAHEIFPEGCCALKGMKLFKRMQMDEAILYAASILNTTEHPFKRVFLESVSEVKDRMPEVSDTAYESKLGLSAWIFDRKVLLGTKEMMGAHGIEIPASAKPDEYIKDNVRIMFLAIDGAVYAMFVLEYFADAVVEAELQRLESAGIQILVRTFDSNVDAPLLSEIFDLSYSSAHILNVVSSSMYDEKTETPVLNEAKIVNRGDAFTFVRSILACNLLSSQFRLLRILQYASMGLGILLIAIFSFVGAIDSIGPVHLVVYSAFWCLISLIIPKAYKAVPKRG